ncbi:MAG TPA: polyprenol monophosphomannose synthase [Candidatus Nanoarchaeia archaeon]|nr:polyprenol monophosphomannose synthase [Candidatus Nanoarchaeia archaeon]
MATKTEFVSVVLPSYNEKGNIAEAIARVEKSLGDRLLEIIVVDDNSPDLTWQVVQDLNNKKVRLIRRINEKGLASALSRGVTEAKGSVVVWMDCDLGLPPEDVPRLVAAIEQGADVAIGSRYVAGGADKRAWLRGFLSTIMNYFAMAVLSTKVHDYTSGFAAAKKTVMDDIGINPHGFGEYFVEFAYRCIKKGYNVTEVGYHYSYRKSGVSQTDKVNGRLLKYGIQYGLNIIKLRFRVK